MGWIRWEGLRRLRATGRLVLVAALATSLACLALLPKDTSADPPVALLPDLVADPPDSPQLEVYDYGVGEDRFLLRFTGYIRNRGSGPVEVVGTSPVEGQMTNVVQRIFDNAGGHSDDGSRGLRVIFEPEDGHDHWHLKDAAVYSLWDSSRSAQVAPSMKVGFCLGDSWHVEPFGPQFAVYGASSPFFCAQHQLDPVSVLQGISSGWLDQYYRSLAFQWVDVSEVQPGMYWLQAEVDPEDVITESVEQNEAAFAAAQTAVPGYVALPVVAAKSVGSVDIALQAESFGFPALRSFLIESAPEHGTLNQDIGVPFVGPQVRYTPDQGYYGPDSFDFSALISEFPFPLHPAVATVTIPGPDPTVAISGAPEVLVAGTSAQLQATVLGDDPDVTWSVDGVVGGTPWSGVISQSGLYTAPPTPPTAGEITIRAESSSGAFDEVHVKIVPMPEPLPSPSAPATAQPAARGHGDPLGRPRVMRRGRFLFVSVRSEEAGLLRITARRRGHRLRRCRVRVPAGLEITCRLRVPRGPRLNAIEVSVGLYVDGRLIDSERVRVGGKATLHG